jgi:hypothetical protein
MNTSGMDAGASRHSPFWPILLLGVTLVAHFGWQVGLGVREYRAGLALADQQRLLDVQASEAEVKLQAMMIELLDLARVNSNAMSIARQFAIEYTPSVEAGDAAGARE